MPRLTGYISEQVEQEVEKFKERMNISDIEAWRRILSLVKVANAANSKGHTLGIIEEKDGVCSVVAKIKGV